MTTRRNMLSILGFTPAAALVSADDVVHADLKPYRLNRCDPKRMADSLERLAKEIRNETINVERFNITSNMVGERDEFLLHTITLDLAVLMDEKFDGTPIT